MAAKGLGGSWGIDTGSDISRSVARKSLPQSVASNLHYHEKKTTQDIYDMPDQEWASISKDNLVSRNDVAEYMRAYEHYQ